MLHGSLITHHLLSSKALTGPGDDSAQAGSVIITVECCPPFCCQALVMLRCEVEALPVDGDVKLEVLYQDAAALNISGIAWRGWRPEPMFFGLEKLIVIVRLTGDGAADLVLSALDGLADVQSCRLISMTTDADTFATCAGLFSTAIDDLHSRSLPCLSGAGASALMRHGHMIIDDWLPASVIAEIATIIDTSLATRSRGEVDGVQWRMPEPRNARTDIATWVSAGHRPGSDAVFTEHVLPKFDALAVDLCSLMPGVAGTLELQLACFPAASGQARYKRHTDAPANSSPTSADRKITAILYCNPSWEEASEGKLRLTGADHDGGGNCDIAPRGGRLLCFLSGAMTHEVLPTKADRYALTAWMS